MANFLQQADGLDPPEDFLYPFVLPETDHVAGTTIDSTDTISTIILAHLPSHTLLSQGLQQVVGVLVLVSSQRRPLPSPTFLHNVQGSYESSSVTGASFAIDRGHTADTRAEASRSNFFRHSAVWADDGFSVGLQ
jgi:hypothetical protein